MVSGSTGSRPAPLPQGAGPAPGHGLHGRPAALLSAAVACSLSLLTGPRPQCLFLPPTWPGTLACSGGDAAADVCLRSLATCPIRLFQAPYRSSAPVDETSKRRRLIRLIRHWGSQRRVASWWEEERRVFACFAQWPFRPPSWILWPLCLSVKIPPGHGWFLSGEVNKVGTLILFSPWTAIEVLLYLYFPSCTYHLCTVSREYSIAS